MLSKPSLLCVSWVVCLFLWLIYWKRQGKLYSFCWKLESRREEADALKQRNRLRCEDQHILSQQLRWSPESQAKSSNCFNSMYSQRCWAYRAWHAPPHGSKHGKKSPGSIPIEIHCCDWIINWPRSEISQPVFNSLCTCPLSSETKITLKIILPKKTAGDVQDTYPRKKTGKGNSSWTLADPCLPRPWSLFPRLLRGAYSRD